MIRARFSLRPVGRILGFDLESRPAAYWYDGGTTAQITAFGWKWTDEDDVRTMLLSSSGRFVRDDGKRLTERRAYTDFAAVLAEAGVVFGHNLRGFDMPLLNAGMLRLQLPPLAPVLVTDTLKDIPKRKDMSASLENLAKMYGLDDDGGKKHMAIVDWERVNRLRPDGIELARERVASDVLLTERLRSKLLDLGILGAPRKWSP